MFKSNPFSAAILLLMSSSLVNANRSSDGTTVTYDGDITNSPIVEQVNPENALKVNGATVTITSNPTITYKSAISLGGNNGILGAAGQDYGNLTMTVDANTQINISGITDYMAALYARSDTIGASIQVHSGAKMNVLSTSTGRTMGTLTESFGGGLAQTNFTAGSNIILRGDGEVYGTLTVGTVRTGIPTSGGRAKVTTDASSQITLNATANTTLLTGLYASGTTSSIVENDGRIAANGAAAGTLITGIHALSSGATTVSNNGQITVDRGATGSSAIKATGANSTVTNAGVIALNTSSGSFGINATSTNNTQVTQRARTAITGTGNSLTGIYAEGGVQAKITAEDALGNTGAFNITLNGNDAVGLYAKGTTGASSVSIENVMGNISVGDGVTSGTTGSVGIKAETLGSGVISYNDSTGTINVTSGSSGTGPSLSAGIAGILDTNATGDMTITVDNINKITVDVGKNATGISAYARAGATGDLIVKFLNGEIDSKGANADGINVYHTGTGNVNVESYGTITATAKAGATATVEGIFAHAATGTSTINAKGNITVHGEDNGAGAIRANGAGGASITYDDAAGKLIATSDDTKAQLAYGVSASAGAAGVTSVWIKSADEISTTASNNSSRAILGTSVDGNTLIQIDQANKISNIGGGVAVQAQTSGAGDARIYIGSDVDYIFSDGRNTTGMNEGVYAGATGTGNAIIESHAKEIYVKGHKNDGIYANAANGNATVIASGIVRTERVNATDSTLYGLVAQTSSANKTAAVYYSGDANTYIDTKGISSSAVLSRTYNGGNAVANVYDATLTTSGDKSHGIFLDVGVPGVPSAGTANSTVINTQITTNDTNSSGIHMQTVDGQGSVDLSNVLIKANEAGSSGLFSTTDNGSSTFTVDQTSVIQGGLGTGAGVSMDSTGAALLTLDNSGSISSLSDQVINSSNATGASVFNNTSTGVMKGFFTVAGNDVTLNNHKGALIDLQDFSSGLKGAVNSNLGGAAVFNHNGLLKFSENNLDGTVSTARFDGVRTFNHYGDGVIDTTSKNPNIGNNGLTGGNMAGDSITIGNGGTGTYVSGGVWKMNVLLDDAGSNGGQGTSDTLNLDNVVTGTGAAAPASLLRSARPGSIGDGKGPLGATTVYVNPTANSFGDLTHGEGIRVVGAISSSDDAFTLGNYVTRGAYQYVLNKGLSDNNWYLSSREADSARKPIYNPSTGAYLANQSAAANMFMHTLFDRQGNSNSLAGDSDEPRSVWMRAKYNSSEGQTANKSMDSETDTTIIQLGADLAKWNVQDGNFHLGLMAGYGESKTDIDPHYTHTKAEAKVEGYSVGAYGTWFADEASGKGLYLDGWVQYGWFDNKVSGPSQVNTEDKYDSSAITASIEAGYGIALGRSSNTEWMLVPQAQLAYTDFSTDDYLDGNNLRIHGSKAGGVFARLGTRLHTRAMEKTNSIQPFVEVNWLYGSAKNEMQFNQVTLEDGTQPDNRMEVKLGLQGTISKNLKVWGQAEGQWGKDSFNRYGGQVGVNYQW